MHPRLFVYCRCSHCRQLEPTWRELARELAAHGIKVRGSQCSGESWRRHVTETRLAGERVMEGRRMVQGSKLPGCVKGCRFALLHALPEAQERG